MQGEGLAEASAGWLSRRAALQTRDTFWFSSVWGLPHVFHEKSQWNQARWLLPGGATAPMGSYLPSYAAPWVSLSAQKPILLLHPSPCDWGKRDWEEAKHISRLVTWVTQLLCQQGMLKEGRIFQGHTSNRVVGSFQWGTQLHHPDSPPPPEGPAHRNPPLSISNCNLFPLDPNPGVAAASHSCYFPGILVIWSCLSAS